MERKVCKFGGTSMADGNVILRAAQIVRAEDSRRYVVVSAPGKRFSGDIKVTDTGADVFCLKGSADYICDNLKKSGRGSVSGEILPVDSFSSADDKYELLFTTVSSLRLDGIIAAFFNLSRSTAAETVNKGLVYVNSSQCLKGDYAIKEGDKIVLRGKGKTVLTEIKGTSKKGKLKIEYKRYI